MHFFCKQNIEEYHLESNVEQENEKYIPIELGFQYGGSPPYLVNFQKTIGERHAENKKIIEHESFEAYKNFLKLAVNNVGAENVQILSSINFIVSNLQGVDCYWNGTCNDLNACLINKNEICDEKYISNTSVTHFGKLYIIPFPFCAIWLADDETNIESIFSISCMVGGRKRTDIATEVAKLHELSRINSSADIMERKRIRGQIRALEGVKCHWPQQKWKMKTVSRQVKHGEETRTETKSVNVLFSFNDGIINIGRQSQNIWKVNGLNISRGFHVTLEYHDGSGSHFDSQWNKNYSWNNESYSAPATDFGLHTDFQITDALNQFFHQNYHETHEDKRMEIIAQFVQYANYYKNEYKCKENILSYAFWYYIYNNDTLSFTKLIECLKCEKNRTLHLLINESNFQSSLNMIYDKLKFFNTNGSYAFWFIFWHDLWMNNLNIKIFKENEEFLSPFIASSVCYSCEEYMSDKEKLKQKLSDIGLHGVNTNFRRGWINDTFIDLLFAKMEEYSGETLVLQSIEIGEEDANDSGSNSRVINIAEKHPLRSTSTVLLHSEHDLSYVEEYQKACTIIKQITHDICED